MEAPTRVAPVRPVKPAAALVEPVPDQPAVQARPAALEPGPRRSDRGRWAALAIVAVLAILAVTILPRLGGGSPPSASAATTAGPSASALPSGDTILLVALGRVDAAVEAASGGKDGLTGRDANELMSLVASVRTAVDRGDPAAAIAAARALSDRARELTTTLDRPRRDALMDAIDGLSEALAAR
jgi:hypothetical protein